MSTDLLLEATRLSDQELLERVQLLARHEREATAALIAHLAVLDERRLYLAEGCSRLFVYCTQVLHFSESAAYRRVEVARAARRYPVILTMLAEGSINLTNTIILATQLTPANHRTLLAAATHKSKSQVEELLASLRPKPLVPSTVRKLPTRTEETVLPVATPSSDTTRSGPEAFPVTELPRTRPVIIPLAPERYKVQFTASKEGYENLRFAQDLLRHQIPNGDVGKIIELALAQMVKDLKKRKLGAADRPRAGRTPVRGSRHIPAEVKREVWARDGGRCAFVAQTGLRCTEGAFLEFHHVVPYSAGGQATIDNIQLRCRSHNGYEAEVHFGTVRTEPESKTVRKMGL